MIKLKEIWFTLVHSGCSILETQSSILETLRCKDSKTVSYLCQTQVEALFFNITIIETGHASNTWVPRFHRLYTFKVKGIWFTLVDYAYRNSKLTLATCLWTDPHPPT